MVAFLNLRQGDESVWTQGFTRREMKVTDNRDQVAAFGGSVALQVVCRGPEARVSTRRLGRAAVRPPREGFGVAGPRQRRRGVAYLLDALGVAAGVAAVLGFAGAAASGSTPWACAGTPPDAPLDDLPGEAHLPGDPGVVVADAGASAR